MLYFIPAWYQTHKWCENEQAWQSRRMNSEFDDTVKQIQLFHRSNEYPYRILLLSYAPNLRHFLHRQSVYHAPCWSCFDSIQEIRRKMAVPVSMHDLAWPEGIEFLNTPFVVVAMLHGERYAVVEFGEDGNMIWIEMYKENQVCRRNIYDDRGFVSSTIIYRDGKPVYQDYLMENGKWKIRVFEKDGHVEVNPEYPTYFLDVANRKLTSRFLKLRYDSIEEVLKEVFCAYIQHTGASDIFCIAMHEQHAAFLEQILMKRRTILSFYMDRYDPAKHPQAMRMMLKADYIITDSKEETNRFLELDDRLLMKITDISPYDTRVDFGISQQLSVQNILVPVDNLSDQEFNRIMVILGFYLQKNSRARVCLLTRNAMYDRPRRLVEQARMCIRSAGLEENWVSERVDTGRMENMVDREVPVRIYVEQCVDELTVSRCMKEQRLIVDLREVPELYIQITAISMGIPQIVRTETQYVVNGENGIVLKELGQLSEALEHYLRGLENWNRAMVACYELGRNFTTDVLIDKWKEVLGFVG